MKMKIKTTTFHDIVILALMTVCAVLFRNSTWVINNCYYVITFASLSLMMLSLAQLKKIGAKILSFSGIFLILLHLFCLGNYYVKAFGREEFFLFGDWFRNDIDVKAEAGFFSLCAIEAIFVGMLLYLEREKDVAGADYKRFIRFDSEQKKRIIYITGVILLCITLPCRLYVDYSNILTSSVNGEYAGFSGVVGVIDDIQTLFIPSLICLMYGKRENRGFCRMILILYSIFCIVVMAASGSRRYYVTAIITIVLFYINSRPVIKERRNPIIYILIALEAIVILNLMTMIRSYRHTALGINYLVNEHGSDLFSLDFLWESFSEFGLTGNVVYYARKFFPESVSYQLGYTYLASFIYILPIGWFVRLQASIGSILFKLSGAAVGGSIVADLFANWGWFSIIPAILLGNIIARIAFADANSNQSSVRTAVSYATSYALLNYVRASTSEIMRYTAYTMIAIYFISRFVSSRFRKV